MASSSEQTIKHFTHRHQLLKEDYADEEFLCDGCMTLGFRERYRCQICDFNLHEYCATCDAKLSSFMHEHDLTLVVRKPKARCQNDRVCDMCREPVEGLFYHCKLCDFDVHPLCTQLPEYVRHVMHKDHRLRLQRSVPGRCMLCKDTCTSWHYRCGICSFDLHLECVLEPCEEVALTPTQSTMTRSLSSPFPQSSANSLFLDSSSYAHGGLGLMIPPPLQYPNYLAYSNYGYVPFPPPYLVPNYVQGHGYGIPSSSTSEQNSHNQDQNSCNSCNSQVQGGKSSKFRRKMYSIVGNLALGVLSNVLFGAISS